MERIDSTSAATIDEDTLIEFVRDWNYSGYHYDLNFSRKLKQELLDAGYKILSREPTEEMLLKVVENTLYHKSVAEEWRKMWEAAE